MSSRSRILALLAALLLASCSGERKPPAGTSAQEGAAGTAASQAGASGTAGGTVSIVPSEVFKGTLLRLSGTNPGQAGTAVEWLVNGVVNRSGADTTFDTSALRKGDTIQARVSGSGGPLLTAPVEVRNSPPAVSSARFVFGEGQHGAGIRVEAEAGDADGDPVEVSIVWRKNGAHAGTGDRLATGVKRGDKVEVTMTPFDGIEQGRSATILREIRNTPPVVEGQEQFQVKGGLVTFRVRASDIDGDALTYELRESPAGMVIDRSSGWVRWESPAGTGGKVPFAVTVSDGSGGEATARFNVTIQEQSAGPSR